MDPEQYIHHIIAENGIDPLIISRHHILTHVGEIERHLYYVESGALSTIYPHEENEQCIRFGYQGSIINALPSYFTSEPSQLELKALRRSTVRPIPRAVMERYITESPAREHGYRKLLELLAVQQVERELDLLTSDPRARLERVLKRSPQVFQEIPAKYIASYLRMSAETLSRLLSKIDS